MQLHTIKLETLQHMTSEFGRLREFISTHGLPLDSTTDADAIDAENEPRCLGNLQLSHVFYLIRISYS